MKRIGGWMTLFFAGLCALWLALALICLINGTVYPLPVMAAAVCWGFGFAWFIRLGRQARGRAGLAFTAAFFLLCACLLLGLILCGFLLFF